MAVSLQVSKREGKGTADARRRRAEGDVPGVLYGEGVKEPVEFTVGRKEALDALEAAFAEGQLFEIKVGKAKKGVTALCRDIQTHYIDGALQHLDFWAVDPDREVTVKTFLVPTGNWNVQRAKGFFMEIKAVRLTGSASALPGVIHFDVSELKEGDKLRLRDLVLPDGVRIAEHGGTVICRQ